LLQKLDNLWWHPKDFQDAISYSCGLVLSSFKPYLKLIQTLTGTKACELSSFLQEDGLGWNTQLLFDHTIQSLPDGGELLVDAVVFPKENTTQMQAESVFSTCQKRVLQGQDYVVLTWTKEHLTQVVGFRKLTTFPATLEMIEHVLSFGLQVKGISADGYYFKANFRKGLRQINQHLVSKPRQDSKWFLGNEYIQLKHWVKTLSIDSFHYYGSGLGYAKSFVMSRHDCPPILMVVLKPKRSCKKAIFLVATNLTLTTREVILAYKRRWRIETVFRDCSQNLGLKSHQAYSETSERHVAMVFLTYNILAVIKTETSETIGRLVRRLQKSSNPLQTRNLGFT
jgi:hypothetical protein